MQRKTEWLLVSLLFVGGVICLVIGMYLLATAKAPEPKWLVPSMGLEDRA